MATDVGVDSPSGRRGGQRLAELAISFDQLVGQFQFAVSNLKDAAAEAPVVAGYEAYGSRYVIAIAEVAHQAAQLGPAVEQNVDDIEQTDRANADGLRNLVRD